MLLFEIWGEKRERKGRRVLLSRRLRLFWLPVNNLQGIFLFLFLSLKKRDTKTKKKIYIYSYNFYFFFFNFLGG